MTLIGFNAKKKKLPDTPGVYFFLGARKKILYIGKAASLRSRVRSYFSKDLRKTRGSHIVRMVEKARGLNFKKTDSVLEALILEAYLIKSHKPPFNTDEKDDKSFNYAVITKERYPRVLLARGKEVNERFPRAGRRSVFGPFPHGGQLKEGLKLIRKIFPYRDTCIPLEVSGKEKRPCFNRQIGLCPGVCTGEVSVSDYARAIRHIETLFQGRKPSLLKNLEREMKTYAAREAFEMAGQRRRQIAALKHIQDVSLIKNEFRASVRDGQGFRIEAYDVAHLGGGSMVGVMTVVEGGTPRVSEYRKFKIRSVSRSNDTAALQEILSRRFGHDEWTSPRLIVVDGGAAQLNAAQKILKTYGIGIPIVSVVKDERHRPRNILGERVSREGREKDILLANAEAHRFAIRYHRDIQRRRLLM